MGRPTDGRYCDSESVRESCSTLLTPSLEDLSAVGSAHSLSEAMLDLSLTLFRLISSFHSGLHLTVAFFLLRHFVLYTEKRPFVKGFA